MNDQDGDGHTYKDDDWSVRQGWLTITDEYDTDDYDDEDADDNDEDHDDCGGDDEDR